MSQLITRLIRLYQYLFSPFLGASCRFWPTCSEYAACAVSRHGTLKGGWLSVKRILRCNPWHPGGHDPVP